MDILVVLAHHMDESGNLCDQSISRLEKAVQLDRYSPSDLLLLCGWAYRSDLSITIADAMLNYVRNSHPHLLSRMRCQRFSRDTVGDAVFTRLYLERYLNINQANIGVVTSEYHVRRASLIFQFVFPSTFKLTFYGSSTPHYQHSKKSITSKEDRSLSSFRRTFYGITPGNISEILETLRSSHPYYNGDVFPKIGDTFEDTSLSF